MKFASSRHGCSININVSSGFYFGSAGSDLFVLGDYATGNVLKLNMGVNVGD